MIEREHPRPRRRLGPPVGVDGPGGAGQGVCGELKATMSEFTVDQGRAEDLISRYLTAALNDSLEDEETLDLGIDAAASLERAVASGLEDDEPDTKVEWAVSGTRRRGPLPTGRTCAAPGR